MLETKGVIFGNRVYATIVIITTVCLKKPDRYN